MSIVTSRQVANVTILTKPESKRMGWIEPIKGVILKITASVLAG